MTYPDYKKKVLSDFKEAFEPSADMPDYIKAYYNSSRTFLDTTLDNLLVEVEGILPPANSAEHYAGNMTDAEHGWDNCLAEMKRRITRFKGEDSKV